MRSSKNASNLQYSIYSTVLCCIAMKPLKDNLHLSKTTWPYCTAQSSPVLSMHVHVLSRLSSFALVPYPLSRSNRSSKADSQSNLDDTGVVHVLLEHGERRDPCLHHPKR